MIYTMVPVVPACRDTRSISTNKKTKKNTSWKGKRREKKPNSPRPRRAFSLHEGYPHWRFSVDGTAAAAAISACCWSVDMSWGVDIASVFEFRCYADLGYPSRRDRGNAIIKKVRPSQQSNVRNHEQRPQRNGWTSRSRPEAANGRRRKFCQIANRRKLFVCVDYYLFLRRRPNKRAWR